MIFVSVDKYNILLTTSSKHVIFLKHIYSITWNSFSEVCITYTITCTDCNIYTLYQSKNAAVVYSLYGCALPAQIPDVDEAC